MREPLPRLAARVAVVLLSGVAGAMASEVAWADTSADGAPADGLSTSNCPAEGAVWSELRTLLPSEVLAERVLAAPGSAPLMRVDDLGASYIVSAAGRRREYRDEARDCPHRARVAALFIALTFEPPSSPAGPPPPSAPGTQAAPSEAATRPAGLRLDLGATSDAGWGADVNLVELGLAGRAAIGSGALKLVLGVSALLPRDVTVDDVRLRHWRLPVDVGVRAQFGGETVAPYLEAGLAVALLAERGRDLASNQTQRGLAWGAFASAGLRFFPSARLAPFVNVRVEAVPVPPAIEALPRGVVGHTPVVWVGVAAGLSIGF